MESTLFRRNQLKPLVHADLIPMIDIIFQLVIFFMLTSSLVTSQTIRVELPKADSGSVSDSTILRVTIDRENNYYLNGRPIFLSTIIEEIEGANSNRNSSIVIEGDQNCSYQAFVKLLDRLQQNGITSYQISIAKN